MTNTRTDALLNRYVAKGGNRDDGVILLNELIESHTGDNLVSALVYNDFATTFAATKFAQYRATIDKLVELVNCAKKGPNGYTASGTPWNRSTAIVNGSHVQVNVFGWDMDRVEIWLNKSSEPLSIDDAASRLFPIAGDKDFYTRWC